MFRVGALVFRETRAAEDLSSTYFVRHSMYNVSIARAREHHDRTHFAVLVLRRKKQNESAWNLSWGRSTAGGGDTAGRGGGRGMEEPMVWRLSGG